MGIGSKMLKRVLAVFSECINVGWSTIAIDYVSESNIY